jgi:hypothetical protein
MSVFSPATLVAQSQSTVPTDADVYSAVKAERDTHAAMMADKNDETTAKWCAAFRRLRYVQEARRDAVARRAGW